MVSKRLPDRFAYLKIFAATPAKSQVIVLGCLIIASLAEGSGVAMLMPVLSIADADPSRPPTGLTRVVNEALAGLGLPHSLPMLLGIFVGGMMIKAALTMVAMTYVGYTVAEVTTNLRLELVDRLMKVRWSYFVRSPVGRFANAISGEAGRAGDAYLSVAQLVALLIQTLLYLTFALLISWRFTLAAVSVGGLTMVLLNRFVRTAKVTGKQQTKRTKSLVARLSDALVGIKPLKAMARHVRLHDLFQRDLVELNQTLRRQAFSRQATRSLQEPVMILFLALGFYCAVTYWQVPVGEAVISILVMGRTVGSLGKVQQQLQTVYTSESAYTSIRKAIADAEREAEIISGTRIPTLRVGCTFENVSFSYGRKPVLEEVSLEIPAGRVTTITGGSGAGKTTVADLLLGLQQPSSGRIFVDGVPLSEINLLRWRATVGYVPQEVILFHDTLMANIALGEPTLDDAAVRAALEEADAWGFVSQLPDGLRTVVGERGSMLSGGQRQRIALARALVHRPQLLILDEATSALDPETEAAICRNVREISGRRSLTVLAITHQPSWVAAADKVYRIAGHRATEVSPQQFGRGPLLLLQGGEPGGVADERPRHA
jgi:ATP-binding cassette subfamily C protein